ncbi:MAG: hypothetical protein ABI615_09905 [Chthoniobacterales bacterium]
MKHALAILSLAVFPLTAAFAQSTNWQKAEYVAADVMGVKNYSIDASPPVGKVFVVRQTETKQNKETGIQEMLAYTGGNRVRLYVVFYDPETFVFATPEMKQERRLMIRTQIVGSTSAQSGWVGPVVGKGWAWGATVGPQGVTFNFTDPKEKKTSVTYTTSIEDYESVKKRIPDLPSISDPNRKWGYVYTAPQNAPDGKK